MLALIKEYKSDFLIGGNPFMTLVKAITGQQISLESAKSVFNRLLERCPVLLPSHLDELSIVDLREIGYSKRKALCIKELGKTFQQKNWDAEQLSIMKYTTIYDELISLKGIGEWTIHMFAIFYRGETDIFPTKDIGIIKAIEKIYFSGESQPVAKLTQFSKKWMPYRTGACWYLWRYLDDEPVLY